MFSAAQRSQIIAAKKMELAEIRRRLVNVRFYINTTKPGGEEESKSAHEGWLDSERNLLRDAANLEHELGNQGI